MSKVYVLSSRSLMPENDWKVVTVVTDFAIASAWVSKEPIDELHKWESTNFNDPEILDKYSKK